MKKGSKTDGTKDKGSVNVPGELSARALKDVLWGTLKGLKTGLIRTSEADSVATQSREILRVVSTQLRISQQTKRPVPLDVVDFSEKG